MILSCPQKGLWDPGTVCSETTVDNLEPGIIEKNYSDRSLGRVMMVMAAADLQMLLEQEILWCLSGSERCLRVDVSRVHQESSGGQLPHRIA